MARWIIQALGLLTLTGCSAGQPAVAPPEAPVVVHLVRFGWHADLILPNEACNPLPPEAPEHFRAAERIAVGWGDAGYFPKADPGIIAAIRAAVVPSPSVVQIRAVNGPIERTYHAQEILALQIEEEDCARVGTFIRSRFALEDSAVVPVPTDRRTRARFFASTDRYHLFHNCNHWVARALRAGGLPLRPFLVPTVELLWKRVERFAEPATERRAGDDAKER